MKISAVVLPSLVLVLIFTASSAFGAPSDNKIKIGVITSLSGDAASIGTAIKNGLTLAFDKMPREVRDRIELNFEDDALDPKKTIAAYNKLISTEDIDILVTSSSGTSKAIAPINEQHGLPMIAIATAPEIVANRRHVVNFWVTPEEEVRVLLPEAERRGYKQIARLVTTHEFPISVKQKFDEQNRGRIRVVLDEEYPPDIKDFKPYITKLKVQQSKTDGVLLILMPGQLGVFAKEARQAGITIPLFGLETFEDGDEVKSSNGALIGQWYVNGDDPNGSFLTEYRSKFKDASIFGAPNAHDIMMLIAAAVQGSGTAGNYRERINDFLHSVKNFSGALGSYSASGDNRFTLPAAVKIVTANGFEKYTR